MTQFIITAPDGKKYKVTGQGSAEQALGAVKKMLGMSGAEPVNEMAERAAAAKAGTLTASPDALARAAGADQVAQDRMTISRDPMAVNVAGKFVQGLPFVGEYADEAAGAVGNMLGMDGAAITERARGQMDAMGREMPKTSLGAQVAGGIAGSIPLAVAAGPAAVASAPTTLPGRVIAGGIAGAVVGGTEGAVSGFGAGTEGNRGRTAVERGAVGAGVGGGVGALAPALAAGVRSIAEAIKGRDVSIISRVLGVDKDAARVVKSAIESDDLVAAQAALRRSGADAMLADASPATAQLLDTAVQSGGRAPRVARTAIEERAARAGTRLSNMLDTLLGRPQGTRTAARAIATRTSGARRTAYERAYSQAIDYAADTGRKIEDVLSRIPARTLRQAVDEANEAMQAAGTRNMQIMASIADDGSVTFTRPLNVQQLDEVKKALGAVAQGETDAITGRITGAGIRAKNLAGELRDAIADAVPSYRTAVKLGGDKIAEDQAFDLGRKLLSPATSRETVADAMNGASREAKAAARSGLRQFIDDALANVQRTITDPNTDAREAMKLVKDLSSRANREKARAVLGKAADTLFDQIEEVTAHLELRSAVARNSATYARTATDRAVSEIAEPGALRTLLAGRPAEASQKFVQLFTGNTGEMAQARKLEIYGQIAEALTTLRGPSAEAALATVQRAIAGQPVTSAEAARIGRVLSTATALSGFQLGTRAIEAQRSAQ